MIVSLLDFYFNHQERWEFHITLRVKFRLNILIRSGDTTSNTRRPEHRRAAGCRQHVYTLPLLEEKWRRRGRRGSERRRLRKNKEGKIREREGREDEKLMERKGKWRKCEEEGMGWWDKSGKGRMRKVEGWERKRKRGGTEKKRKRSPKNLRKGRFCQIFKFGGFCTKHPFPIWAKFGMQVQTNGILFHAKFHRDRHILLYRT